MAFPQRWDPDAGLLGLRVAALPFTDPLAPLAAGQPAFADADLELDALLVPSLARLPRRVDARPPIGLPPRARPNRRALFEHLRARFEIAVAPPAPPRPVGSTRIKKYLP